MKTFLKYTFFCLIFVPKSQAQGPIKAAALEALIEKAKLGESASLAVSSGDSVQYEAYFRGKPTTKYSIYSVTKLVAGLAVGILYDKGLITSAEEPLSKYFEEWKNDPIKQHITIRQVLQHTSGLYTTKGSRDIYPQADFVAFALQDSVVSAPGATFQYNNRAINLLSGLVRRRTGQNMEAFVNENLFKPLGIKDYDWMHDKNDNTWAMDGLKLSTKDLLKIGMVLANKGQWQGQRVVSARWLSVACQLPLVNALTGAGGWGYSMQVAYFEDRFLIPQTHLQELQRQGLPERIVTKLLPIADSLYDNWGKFGKALGRVLSRDEVEEMTKFCSHKMLPTYHTERGSVLLTHSGEIGQWVVILPTYQIAAVRFIDEKFGRKLDEKGNYRYPFGEILTLVANLVR